MLAAIPDIQSQRLDIKTKTFEESIGNDATTEKDHRLVLDETSIKKAASDKSKRSRMNP